MEKMSDKIEAVFLMDVAWFQSAKLARSVNVRVAVIHEDESRG